MLVFTVKKNSQHPGTGDIESTFVKLTVDVPAVEAELLREWNGMKDSYVVECRIRKDVE